MLNSLYYPKIQRCDSNKEAFEQSIIKEAPITGEFKLKPLKVKAMGLEIRVFFW
jgi:hypothetical protein